MEAGTAPTLALERTESAVSEEAVKGRLAPGQLADLAVLDADYLSVPEDEIAGIESLLTVTGGRIVHGAGPFADRAPDLPPASPDWSPVATFGGYEP